MEKSDDLRGIRRSLPTKLWRAFQLEKIEKRIRECPNYAKKFAAED